MKNKEKDIPYCGVRQEKIKRACPQFNSEALNLFLWFIQERYTIHIKKDVKRLKPPYTDNEVLKKFKFTNVRREHDRETKYLIKNIATADLSLKQKLLNIILFRIYSKHETFEMIGGPINFNKDTNVKALSKNMYIYSRKHPEYAFFTNAFLSSGLKTSLRRLYPGIPFVPALPIKLVKTLKEENFVENLLACNTAEDVYETLKSVYGISDFMAYQIFVDFTYIPEFPYSENEFTVAGLGCKRGVDCLFDNKNHMTYEECLFWLRDNWEKLKEINENNGYDSWFDPKELMIDLPKYDRIMNIMSLENCFCEFFKYWKTIHHMGRPRSKYNATKRYKENNNE